MDWQPIETAPKDGSEVDLWVIPHDGRCRGRVPNCYFSDGGWRTFSFGSYVDGDISSRYGKPTHWMKVDPPSGGADGHA